MSTATEAPSITETAQAFFAACETGKGWEACSAFCQPDASFAAQAEPLADVRTLKDYADWMKGLLGFVPDGRYEVKSFATDHERNNVSAYGVFSGTHTGEGGAMRGGDCDHDARLPDLDAADAMVDRDLAETVLRFQLRREPDEHRLGHLFERLVFEIEHVAPARAATDGADERRDRARVVARRLGDRRLEVERLA